MGKRERGRRGTRLRAYPWRMGMELAGFWSETGSRRQRPGLLHGRRRSATGRRRDRAGKVLFGVEKRVSRRFACSPDGRGKSESEGCDGFLLVQALRAFRARARQVVERRRGGADGVRNDKEMPVLVATCAGVARGGRNRTVIGCAAAVGLAEQLRSVGGVGILGSSPCKSK
jgi:hypothetical protein